MDMRKKEIALNRGALHIQQLRAISLRSYYLTSLVNLAFYNFKRCVFDPPSFLGTSFSKLFFFPKVGCFYAGTSFVSKPALLWLKSF